ncbi:MAG: Rieske (2Fe-2S) protein [Pirellulales bacterium]|nr:Rieske (2Fe-2S) protein [Pirellulales bacterium]
MWHTIATLAECPPGTNCERVVAERIIGLCNINGVFYALDGVCPHQGGPLGQGRVTDCWVTCPWHGWQFDVRDGQHRLNAKLRQTTYPTRVVGEEIQVEIVG